MKSTFIQMRLVKLKGAIFSQTAGAVLLIFCSYRYPANLTLFEELILPWRFYMHLPVEVSYGIYGSVAHWYYLCLRNTQYLQPRFSILQPLFLSFVVAKHSYFYLFKYFSVLCCETCKNMSNMTLDSPVRCKQITVIQVFIRCYL